MLIRAEQTMTVTFSHTIGEQESHLTPLCVEIAIKQYFQKYRTNNEIIEVRATPHSQSITDIK